MTQSLRARKRALTSDAIIQAAAAVVVEQGAHSFSMDEVASRSGVSLRTVYRYFETREALLLAIGERLRDELEADGVPSPDDDARMIDQMLGVLTRRFAVMGENEMLARATVATLPVAEASEGGVLRTLTAAREVRNQVIRDAIRESTPNMPDEVHEQLFGVMRLLGSIVGWSHLTAGPSKLDGESAGVAVRWAIETLMARARELESAGVGSLQEDPS